MRGLQLRRKSSDARRDTVKVYDPGAPFARRAKQCINRNLTALGGFRAQTR